VEKRYAIVKEEKSKEITYIEYERKKGYEVLPKNQLITEEMVRVREMIIINPSLIKKLISKKCNRTLKKIIDLLSLMDETGDEGGGFSGLVLNEIAHFESLLEGKYQAYMEREAYEIMKKKIEILKMEMDMRRARENDFYLDNQESRGSR